MYFNVNNRESTKTQSL